MIYRGGVSPVPVQMCHGGRRTWPSQMMSSERMHVFRSILTSSNCSGRSARRGAGSHEAHDGPAGRSYASCLYEGGVDRCEERALSERTDLPRRIGRRTRANERANKHSRVPRGSSAVLQRGGAGVGRPRGLSTRNWFLHSASSFGGMLASKTAKPREPNQSQSKRNAVVRRTSRRRAAPR